MISVLDHGFVKLIDTWGSEEGIIEAARMSTQKGFKGWGPLCAECEQPMDLPHPGPCGKELPDGKICAGMTYKDGDEKLLSYLWRHKHHTPFEMGGATFEVQAPIFVFREWHRHRVPFGYNEMSARYAPLPDVNYIPTIERLMKQGGHLTKQAAGTGAELTEDHAKNFLEQLEYHYQAAERIYQSALGDGVPKELARIVLPVGRYSRMRATGNLRGWINFLFLREPATAQEEIRVYAQAVHKLLSDKFPRTMRLYEQDSHG